MGLNRIYNMEYRVGMLAIESESVDLIPTCPPFNIIGFERNKDYCDRANNHISRRYVR